MKIFLEITKVAVLAAMLFGLAACASINNAGYQGGDHRGGGPSGAYGSPDAKVNIDASDKAAKKENSSENDVYTGGDHRGGGPHGPLG